MTERIRWEPAKYGGWTGHTGTMETWAFQVWKPDPDFDKEWRLDSVLPGQFAWHLRGKPEALKKGFMRPGPGRLEIRTDPAPASPTVRAAAVLTGPCGASTPSLMRVTGAPRSLKPALLMSITLPLPESTACPRRTGQCRKASTRLAAARMA